MNALAYKDAESAIRTSRLKLRSCGWKSSFWVCFERSNAFSSSGHNSKISVGIVASVTLENGTVLPGGAEQILLPKDWPEEWVQGYRRITARQLQSPPRYRAQKPDTVSVGKDKLYSHICPLCGYEHVQKLRDDEQFDIVGIKGNLYTMKWKCLDPKCEYYW